MNVKDVIAFLERDKSELIKQAENLHSVVYAKTVSKFSKDMLQKINSVLPRSVTVVSDSVQVDLKGEESQYFPDIVNVLIRTYNQAVKDENEKIERLKVELRNLIRLGLTEERFKITYQPYDTFKTQHSELEELLNSSELTYFESHTIQFQIDGNYNITIAGSIDTTLIDRVMVEVQNGIGDEILMRIECRNDHFLIGPHIELSKFSELEIEMLKNGELFQKLLSRLREKYYSTLFGLLEITWEKISEGRLHFAIIDKDTHRRYY